MENNSSALPPSFDGVAQEDKTLALITHLSGILIGFILPLIIWLTNKDKPEKAFLTDQSKEALNFQITVAIALAICVVLSFLIIGVFVMPIVGIGNLVFCILAGIKANEGVAYRYPFTLRLIK